MADYDLVKKAVVDRHPKLRTSEQRGTVPDACRVQMHGISEHYQRSEGAILLYRIRTKGLSGQTGRTPEQNKRRPLGLRQIARSRVARIQPSDHGNGA